VGSTGFEPATTAVKRFLFGIGALAEPLLRPIKHQKNPPRKEGELVKRLLSMGGRRAIRRTSIKVEVLLDKQRGNNG
jgi:hypothetical protein